MVEWLERLDYRAESRSPDGRELEAGLCHLTTGKLSPSTQQGMGTFFELGGRLRQRKERDGLRLSSMPKTQ